MSKYGHRSPWRFAPVPAILLALLLVTPALADYTPDPSAPRSEIPAQYQWQWSHIYADLAAWEADMATIEDDIGGLAEYQGRLGESAATLVEFQDLVYAVRNKLMRLAIYAQLRYDVDQGNDDNRTLQGRVGLIFPVYGRAMAFVEPELLTIDPAVIKGFMAENEQLAVYEYYFAELWRNQKHTLSAEEEAIMALSGNVRGVPGSAHNALLGVDIDFPEIVGEDGQTVPVTLSGWSGLRASETYNVRKQATDAFFGTLRKHENTFAVLLDGVVKSHLMTKQARGYDSCLQASLDPDNISPAAYTMLIDTLRENLGRTLHKYVDLRRKVMGIDGPLTFPNLYNAMLEGVEPEYTYDEGCKLIAKALQPLGKEYVALANKGMDPASGWTDVYPNEDKESGAYSNGALARTIHPFVKQNFDNTLDAVSTCAHEFGHAVHSHYSNTTQPPIYNGYATFLAEVASTVNEALLTDYMLEQYKKDVDMTLLLLNQRLESIRLTIFRQTLFADFELRFHEHAEAGNPLTASYLNELYAGLIREYYGPGFELGTDDECEWMFIPHFYYNFYVFTYATGLTSGLALATEIAENGDKAAQQYIDNMLKAGSSAPPLDILRAGGVDLETPAPIEQMLDVFERTIDEFDRIWTKHYGN